MLTEMRPIEYFKEMVATAVKHQRIRTCETTEFYLSTLLADFTSSEKLGAEPLAITYLKALESDRSMQGRLLKDLGDIALFTSGFFSDSLKRKIMDVDYYISMGASAYANLAAMHKDDRGVALMSGLFAELSDKFKVFVDVLTEVSETTSLTSSKDVLRVYERWLRTKSKRAEATLRALGIEPLEVSTKTLQ